MDHYSVREPLQADIFSNLDSNIIHVEFELDISGPQRGSTSIQTWQEHGQLQYNVQFTVALH